MNVSLTNVRTGKLPAEAYLFGTNGDEGNDEFFNYATGIIGKSTENGVGICGQRWSWYDGEETVVGVSLDLESCEKQKVSSIVCTDVGRMLVTAARESVFNVWNADGSLWKRINELSVFSRRTCDSPRS